MPFPEVLLLEKVYGVCFIGSTPLRTCHIQKEHFNKVFEEVETKGQSSIGWFFGVKLLRIINDKEDFLNIMLSPEVVDDRVPLKDKIFHQKVFGKLIGYKRYISKTIFEQLFIDSIYLITKVHKNMIFSLTSCVISKI